MFFSAIGSLHSLARSLHPKMGVAWRISIRFFKISFDLVYIITMTNGLTRFSFFLSVHFRKAKKVHKLAFTRLRYGKWSVNRS